ncbi:sn-glycerol-3-phosphate import ATP-binding protein UgpC [Candidatus Endolissoclinum faulkneri L5]|uniref:sn-glycerol-3-phosphate import ATP-binding protein UgpC n=1 Tax=Candidatus Endolissoclinum faulkneri L5 TaxID=1401328 RepID=V9TWP6_9PROT|nr:sn-glycerol-3-phosphate ABC transporter ATP-binding protein UgpC [Candidatus Endolissoclinum faulkneri]AHC73725.1 sn-glycerol-3-phosphate import ATP-binding protein UgpC [Candidatus Endolissoclinum faulkneri L5]
MADVTMRDLHKNFGDTEVINGIDLSIKDGTFCVLVGPSGCGKSTLLRMIAGLEDIDAGELSIGGQVMNNIDPSKRGVSMVFQSYALYPHMTVYQNMSFGLKLAKTASETIENRVRNAAEILQLTDLLDRKPKELSGGQRQRVAIGRAIVRNPKAFLFDEPLSNLDAALRVQMRLEISRLHRRLGTTMIHVTHDQVEAMTLADQIVVLNQGIIEQTGSPRDLYDRPANVFVASFLGSPAMNLLKARVDGGSVVLDGTNSRIDSVDGTDRVNGPVTLGFRPEHVELSEDGIPFEVEFVEDLGDACVLHGVLAGGPQATVRVPAEAVPLSQEDRILNVIPIDGRCHLFDRQSGRRC